MVLDVDFIQIEPRRAAADEPRQGDLAECPTVAMSLNGPP